MKKTKLKYGDFYYTEEFQKKTANMLECLLPGCPICMTENHLLIQQNSNNVKMYVISCEDRQCKFKFGPFYFDEIFNEIDKLIYKFNQLDMYAEMTTRLDYTMNELKCIKEFISSNKSQMKYLDINSIDGMVKDINNFIDQYNDFIKNQMKI